MTGADQIIERTRCWVSSVIVKHNFCPFAKRELDRGSIHYRVIQDKTIEACLQALVDECLYLDANEAVETSLLVLARACDDYEVYLGALELAERLLEQQGYHGIYQLASFHPDYVFAAADADDAANYTNRSPYPMFHIIREASIEKALQHYPDPETIPERNIEHARTLGPAAMKAQLDRCRGIKKS